MGKRAEYEIPAGLQEAQERFTEWRSSHTGRRPIPEALWALASELARQHGVFRTAQVLRLDYTKLKRHTQAVGRSGNSHQYQLQRLSWRLTFACNTLE